MSTKIFRNAAVVLATLLATSSLGGTALAQSITIAIGSEPSTLDPQLRDDGGERQVNDNIYEALMTREAAGKLVPGLAAAEPTQINDTTWQFKLREGVKFHNGAPFNADSVVATVTRIIDPANNSEQMAYFNTIVGAEKVDELTVNILTSGTDPILPSRMYWMRIIDPEYSRTGDLASAPVGTGPYKFDSWNRGSDLKLVANSDYWGGAPKIKEATYRFVAEPGTRLSGLMAGEFDLITNLLPEFTTSVPKFAAVPGLETSVFALGTDNEVVKDPKVREALNLAIDRQSMIDGLFMGYATIANGTSINHAAFGHNKELKSYPFDLARAQQLIKDAGAVGKPLHVIGESGRWLKDREQIEAVAAFWSQTGLTVTVEIQEFSQYLDSLMGDGPRPDAIFLHNSNELLDADRESSYLYHKDGQASSNSDEEMATKIDAARVEPDQAKRKALYDEIQQRIHDRNYAIPLFNLQDIYGLSERMVWQPRVDAKLKIIEMDLTE
jgi:peptide/nickel transport system substrate-binding protein